MIEKKIVNEEVSGDFGKPDHTLSWGDLLEYAMETRTELKEISDLVDDWNKKYHKKARKQLSKVDQWTSVGWLTSKEAAVILKVSGRTLQSYRDTGRLKFTKIGGRCRYKKKDIKKALLENYNGEKVK